MDVVYTSDSSDNSEQKVVELAHRNMNQQETDNRINFYIKPREYEDIETLLLNHNLLSSIPLAVTKFQNLKVLDVSSNGLNHIPEIIFKLPLVTFIAKNNKLNNESLPKSLVSEENCLKEINLSGNRFTHFPEQVIELINLKYLYMGGNQITTIPACVKNMQSLQLLSMGGNQLKDISEAVGTLQNLQALVLADNCIERLPTSIARLKNLKSLLLHKNRLRTLPREIVELQNLTELSLRDNPLVVRFIQDISINCPSLLELAGRAVKLANLKPGPEDLPRTLLDYLRKANCCVNPKCKGVYFDDRVEHIKFVDFCGKYRVPLLQYLCSSRCIEDASQPDSSTDSDEDMPQASGYMMRKVLLG